MSKAYPSNLTLAQYEFLSDLIPEPKLESINRKTPLSGAVLAISQA